MKVKGLFTDESKWIQGTSWRDSLGNELQTPEYAEKYCLAAAVECCHGESDYDFILHRIAEHLGLQYLDDVIFWNDSPERTFAEVKKLVNELDI